MTLSELITHLASKFPQLDHQDAEASVKAILKSISNQLVQGERVEIRGFGSFSVQNRPPRMARNPKTGESVQLAEKHIPHFRPSTALRKRVNLDPPQVTSINVGGRPPTNGAHPGWMLIRATIVIEAFTKAREAGEKYESSLDAAVNALNEFNQKIKASRSMVKKILKEFMPADGEEMLYVTKNIAPFNPDAETPSVKTSYGVKFAPRPLYPHPSKIKK